MKDDIKIEIEKFLDSKFNDMIKFTQQLVRINSVNGNETEVAKLVQKKLKQYGIESKLIGIDKERMNLLAEIGNGKRSLILSGHTDTVPLGNTNKWKYKPLSGRYIDGRIYGRGAYDMKGSVASMVFSLIALNNIKLHGKVVFALSSAEEGGGLAGIKFLLKNDLDGDACIVGEPMTNKKLSIGQRGVYRFEIITIGRTWHTGSKSSKGINAVTKMAKVLLTLEELKTKYKYHKMFPPPRITPGTVIGGGIAVNIYPDECRALVDCRLSYGQDKKTIERDIKNKLDELKMKDKKLKFKINDVEYTPPYIVDINERIVKLSQNYIKKILDFTPKINVAGGASDGNEISRKKIPVVTFGVLGDNAHSENEYVVAKSILDISKVYAFTAVDFFNGE